MPASERRPIDAVNLIALKDWEVLLVAVRTDRRVTPSETRKLTKLKAGLANHSKIVEWHWPHKAREPEERRIA